MDFKTEVVESTRFDSTEETLTNYVAYQDSETGSPRIGHLNFAHKTIQPLSLSSGTPISNLYQVIEAGPSQIIALGNPLPASLVKILAPLTGRDVLCVGKNYAEHAKEFNSSGFDSSDKVDVPSHPVIFTKRYTSIIADGEAILPHSDFTQTADYEGEIGVIIGKAGFRIKEEEAMNHVWGYTIINDMTARERQRDHKQFYIGKSPDTFCPMGPIAVPASRLEKVLRVQTHVNGKLRQDATTDDLIFSIPYLIKTMSEGQTLMPGDVLATGTPAGVGIGRKPPIYLQPGDTISVSISGLGTLTNRIAYSENPNVTIDRHSSSNFALTNAARCPQKALTLINGKPLYYKSMGNPSGPPIVFMHDLGATSEYFNLLITTLKLEDNFHLHLFDMEGHGASPTHPLSTITFESLVADLAGVFDHAGITAGAGATLIADSMGSAVAVKCALHNQRKVAKLLLLTPTPLQHLYGLRADLKRSAEMARMCGMAGVLDSGVDIHAGPPLQPLVHAARRVSLLGLDPEGYAKGCMAFTGAEAALGWIDYHYFEGWEEGDFITKTLVVPGRGLSWENFPGGSYVSGAGGYQEAINGNIRTKHVPDVTVSQWAVWQDLDAVAKVVRRFLSVVPGEGRSWGTFWGDDD